MSAAGLQAPWPLRGRSAVQEVAIVWSLAFGSLLVAFLLFGMSSITKLVATAGFLYLPLWAMRARGEDFRDYGVTLAHWREDLRLFLLLALVILPLFGLAFWGFAHLLPLLPEPVASLLSPTRGAAPALTPRLAPDFAEIGLECGCPSAQESGERVAGVARRTA